MTYTKKVAHLFCASQDTFLTWLLEKDGRSSVPVLVLSPPPPPRLHAWCFNYTFHLRVLMENGEEQEGRRKNSLLCFGLLQIFWIRFDKCCLYIPGQINSPFFVQSITPVGELEQTKERISPHHNGKQTLLLNAQSLFQRCLAQLTCLESSRDSDLVATVRHS